MKPESPDRLLSRDEVAYRFGLSRRWLELAAHKGEGPPMVKISRRMVRYRAADIEAWLHAHRVGGKVMVSTLTDKRKPGTAKTSGHGANDLPPRTKLKDFENRSTGKRPNHERYRPLVRNPSRLGGRP